MVTTLQKEYALIYYIQKKLKQPENNGFLHELYTPENVKLIVEELVKKKAVNQPTINIGHAVEDILRKLHTENLVNPNQISEKNKLLPYDTVSFMQIFLRRTIDNILLNMKQRLFIDDITDAKDGMAAYFVSTFTIKNMTDPSFSKLVKMERRPNIDEIANELHKKYPNSPLFKGVKDMSELEAQIAPLIAPLTKIQCNYYDLASLFRELDNTPTVLDKNTLTNAIDAVIKEKQEGSSTSFDTIRNHVENNVKARIKESPDIEEFLNKSADSRFVGTIKYKKNGTLDGTTRQNIIDVSLRKEDRNFDTFIEVINHLLSIEGLAGVSTDFYKNKQNVLLTEQQYHALFPEYFTSFGAIKEKVKSESEMGGSTMKSGDEKTSVIDSYSRDDDNDDEEEEDVSLNSPDLHVGKTTKLMFAKMLATINGHPETVPDVIESKMGTKAMIYSLNRILITELFNTSYANIEWLAIYLGTGQIPEEWSDETASALQALRDTYIKESQAEHQEYAQRDIHVKAFATILSELSRLAKMDPKNELKRRESGSNTASNNVTFALEGYTYVLSNASLSAIVKLMASNAIQGKYVESMSLTSTNTIKCALDFLKDSGLLHEANKVFRLESDIDSIKHIVNGLGWAKLPTIHHSMMSAALRNCSYIYKHNGWEPMSNDELSRTDFAPVQDEKKNTTVNDDIQHLLAVVERMQGQIKPYMLNLQAVNYVMELIQKQYHIADLKPVAPPQVDEDTLSISDTTLHSFATEESAESFDRLSQGFYLRHIIEQYDDLVNDACDDIKKTLTRNHLLNEGTRDTLLSKVHNSGRPAKIINDIFGEKKQENYGNMAEDFNSIEMRNIFTVAQYVVLLYNKALEDVRLNNPEVASNFYTAHYVTSEELTKMAAGQTPSNKMYSENGNLCKNDFLLNAYLIDILFRAMYLITVNFNIQTSATYTAQEVSSMKDVGEMKKYINETIKIKVNNVRYTQLLSAINNRVRLHLLYDVHMLNFVNVIMVTHPEVEQLTVDSYKNINGDTTNTNIPKMMQGFETSKQKAATIKRKKAEEEANFSRLFRPD